MPLTTTSLALAVLLALTPQEPPRSEPPAPAEVEAPAPSEPWFPDRNRTRYLIAPGAMMLRQGEGFLSQQQLLFTSVSYGLTDNITLQAGSVLPAWLLGPLGFNGLGGVKVGGRVAEGLHLAAGAHVFFLPGVNGSKPVGLVLGTATYGTPDAHLSVSVGKPLTPNRDDRLFNPQLLTALNGNVRVGRRLALVSENWLVPTLFGYSDDAFSKLPMVNSLALRIFEDNWAVTVGGIYAPGLPFPVPWLDYTHHFG
jgi:hypothetical protein